MKRLRKGYRRLFFKKPTHTKEEIEALRLDFKERYQHFRHLIHANNRALATMADMAQALRGEHPFGMTFVRSCCTTVSVKVYQMVRKLNLLAPDRYKELFDRFDQIQARIDPILNSSKPSLDQRMVIPLKEIDKEMVDLVGSKMANLGEIKNNIGLRVPKGFVVTAHAYHCFIQHNDLRAEINSLLQSASDSDTEAIYRLNAKINQMIVTAEVPHDLEVAILAAWQRIEKDAGRKMTVAMRSSALGEDEKDSSFAGMHMSELNVSQDHVIRSYKDIVASKYSLPAMNYRLQKGFRDEDIAMCVGCLEMVAASAGGVIYTRNPIDTGDDNIFINANWGLPKAVVDGAVNCDLFVVSRREPLKIIHSKIANKKSKLVCYPQEGVCRINLTDHSVSRSSLSSEQVISLSKLAIHIETYYGGPQDIEWAIDAHDQIFILQCRPLQQSEIDARIDFAHISAPSDPAEIIAGEGVTASPGAACGPVFKVENDLDVLRFPTNAILLTHSALPRWASLLNRATAVITEQGSFAGHLANVAREFNVPALFGVPDILTLLNTGDLITIEAQARRIFRGRREALLKKKSAPKGLMEESPVFQALQDVSQHILPLTLLAPDAPEFHPSNCQTLQDITRFIHEKSIREMFSFGKAHPFSERTSKQLYYKQPMKWWILNLDDGFKKEIKGKYVKVENIASIPMLTFWEGFTAIPWEGPPAIDGKGLMSVMFQSTSNPALVVGRHSTYMDQNYFMIAKNYCNLSSRLGYHFATMEAYVADRATENYLKFQFKGGAADDNRRLQRLLLIQRLLEEFGFRTEVAEDNLVSRIEGREQRYMLERILILGYLSIHSRQIDMIMTNHPAIKAYQAKFRRDIDFLLNQHQPQFMPELAQL